MGTPVGEWWLSNVKEEYGLGVYTHSALGPKELIYRRHIYKEIIERIAEYNPKISVKVLRRLENSLWLIFDGINSHNGEMSDIEIIPDRSKTEEQFEEEIMLSHTQKGFDRHIKPATLEGSLIRMCDKSAYTPFDMVDGLYEGFIPKIEGEHEEILRMLGISQREINEANLNGSYEGIARKVQVIFAKSMIENSSQTGIRMDEKTRNINA